MPNNVLVTGGTGSFGRAFIKRLLEYGHDGKIIIYSRDEQKQEQMAREFKELDKSNVLRFFVGDIRDKQRLRLALTDVHTVVHTAALKIVPTLEYNPIEAIKTNILGSQNLIEICCEPCPFTRKVIALSTDKAVHPINLYGSTKLCMEKLFIAANNMSGNYAKFSIVRYGNVAGSRGSVIPLFKSLRDTEKTIFVTDPNMTRFWITLYEATQFVINMLETMKGGEIFVPEMPVYRLDMLADLYSKDVVYTGLRPGEKMHEDLLTKYEMARSVYMEHKGFTFYAVQNVDIKSIDHGSLSSSNFTPMTKQTLRLKLKKEKLI